ncbi:RNA polymerase sigma factor [Devosia nitrariae]|uniref:ECF subfamily RNA polymerase sigma-24 factor n=1 Tax=Devosia nitrariae TaxID=2071872 RepID=A0ABQ5W399_9HYPH|nr:sigma-70 family RNA polymerase sigma factor [Devosia nitrariae]GLQ54447.1 ECF subfamily RNA polymerase sigma-24 factor [Devosia nitrariae]
MRPQHYSRLRSIAQRWSRRPDEADDLVQDALVEAVRLGRSDFTEAGNFKWIAGVIRNRARVTARSAGRRRRRDATWWAFSNDAAEPTPAPIDVQHVIEELPRTLKSVAALALSGHNRREIAYLLDLKEDALRQRISKLRRILRVRGMEMPSGLPGLNLDLAYGRIRNCLLPELKRQGGIFAAHDPDGHLFVVTRSRNDGPRQQQDATAKGKHP